MSSTNFKQVRQASGLSQEAFARLLDLSVDSVRSLEQGKMAVSYRTASQVAAKTGALAIDVMDGEPASALTRAWHGRPYETTDFHAWRAGTGLLENTDRLTKCIGAFIAAIPLERRAEIQAHFAQLMFRPEFNAITNDACRVQRSAGNYDLEDLRGFTARVNQ